MAHGLALQGGNEGLGGLGVLIAFLNDEDVGIGLGGHGILILDGQGIAHLEAGLNGIVAVNHGDVHILQGAGQLGSLDLLDIQVLGVLGDIQLGSGKTDAFLKLDQALGLEQQKRASFVGAVVGDGYSSAIGQVRKARCFAGIDAKGLIVDGGHGNQMRAVLSVEVRKVGLVLEVVGV